MAITITDDKDHMVRFDVTKFKGGEKHVTIPDQLRNIDRVTIQVLYEGDDDIFLLMLLTDALRRIDSTLLIDLYIPYFPGARQDRVCNPGESLTVKVYADLINTLKFESVTIFDPHSDVTPALINNVIVIDNHRFIKGVICTLDPIVLISPDAGSNKKIFSLAKDLHVTDLAPPGVIRCDKIRDTKTGKILRTDVMCDNEDIRDRICLIVDDIISGGRTFMEIAKILKARGARKVLLAVSHHECVANDDELRESGIDRVYTTTSRNIWGKFDPAYTIILPWNNIY